MYNYSKQYVLNQHVRKIIEELCTEYGINPEDKYIKRATKIINITGKLTTNHIKKTYNLTLGKGRSVPGLTEEEALDLIYQQYPQIIEIGKVIDYDNEHYLEDGPDVFNVNFDDLREDRKYKGHVFRTITQEQADDMVDFIEKNLGKHFIVHCKAGASRSQAVHRFILDMYPDQYEKCPENLENPCETPNMEVVRKLKIAWRNRHGGSAFGEITG